MKRLLLYLGLIILSCNIVSAKKIFVEMEFHKNSIKLDDGTNKKRQPIKDENGKDLKFKSLIGALNYMSLQGWELLETKSVTKGSGAINAYIGISETDTKVYYIFCKEVTDEGLQEAVNNSYKE